MNNITIKSLFQKKLQIFFLFYLVLLLPVLTPLAENLSTQVVLLMIGINTVLFIAISVLLLFVTPRWEKIIYSLFFVVAYLPGSIYISYLLFADVLLQGNSVISLFETNPAESKEFLAHYFNPWIVVAIVAYVFICFAVIWIMKGYPKHAVKKNKAVFTSAAFVFLLIICTPSLSESVYFVNFYRLFVNYKIKLQHEEKAIDKRQNIPYEVKVADTTHPKTIVVVIGESLTRTHMSLYGYTRKTNPYLSSLGDSLIIYQDVISPQVHTIPVLRSILTMADRDNLDYITEKPSMFELFNRAGYETYFISNQPFGGQFKTSYDALLNLAQNIHNVSTENLQDEIVLPTLQRILANNTDSKKNKLILIHLIGNHMAYEFRYTPAYNIFNNNKDHLIEETPYRDQKAIHTIDKYDNSVLYNDHLIYRMIQLLQNQSSNESALVYFSDHGEEIFESRNFAGHAYEKISAHMCEIPFVVWLSPEYRKERTDLEYVQSRPYSTCDFIFSLSDLAQISYEDYKDQKSIFSKKFEEKTRYVGDMTYEEVKTLKR